jgi:hypothetical protein
MDLIDLPNKLRLLVDREIAQGETICWLDRPNPARYGWEQAWTKFLVGIPFTAFAIFWIWAAAGGMAGPQAEPGPRFVIPLVFGTLFVLVGLGMLTSPLWMSVGARSTVYLITDRRAIIISAPWNVSVQSFGPANLTEFHRTERSNGYGKVIFHRYNYVGFNGQSRTRQIGFYAIANVKDVEDMLRDLARTGPKTP